jgi:hypothetical protein
MDRQCFRAAMRARLALLVLLTLLTAAAVPRGARAQAGAHAEFFLGAAWNAPLPLTIRTTGGAPLIHQRAHFSTRPLRDSPYYAYRAGYRDGRGRAVEAELLHHKLYLDNPIPPIQHLEITHGYNLPMLNCVAPLEGRVPTSRGWQLRVGLGLVVAHPEGQIAEQPMRAKRRTVLGGGYHVAGAALQLTAGRRYPLGRGRVVLTAAPEVKLTAAVARMRITQGTLVVPNLAAHALAGLGVEQRGR